MAEQYDILGGKVHVYKRPNSSHWQCSTYFAGKNRRTSTKEDSLAKAKEFAEDWYLELRGKLRNGEIKQKKPSAKLGLLFCANTRSSPRASAAEYVQGQHTRSRVHLVPFFGDMGLSEITPGQVQEYRIHRHEEAVKEHGKPPARSTMHQEIVLSARPSKPPCATDGWTGFRISPSPTGHRGKSHTAHGFPRRNTRSSMKPRDGARTSPKIPATNGNRNSFTTTSCSWPIPACGRTRRAAWNFAM